MGDRTWLQECERASLFARQFYEREGDYAATLDILTMDGARHVVHLPSTEPSVFVSLRQSLGQAKAWCFSVLGTVCDKQRGIEADSRCLIVMGHELGGGWYGRLWRIGGDGLLREPSPLEESTVSPDVLLVPDRQ